VGIKLAFMGSSSFALPTLNQLFENGFDLQAVITQPDKPTGRGQSVQGPPAKQRAFELHLAVYQPNSLKTDEARGLFSALAPEMIVVVAYGKILPSWLLHLPRFGCVNLHGSLLPKYRGAAPVHWAIANGETETGVCSMLLEEGLDTGPVYRCERTTIAPDETAPELYERLAGLGAPLMLHTVQGIADGTLVPTPQDASQATLAPMLRKEDGILDWTRPAAEIHNRVRAFNPWPGTVTRFRGAICKIVKSRVLPETRILSDPAGAGLIHVSKGRLAVVCGDGALIEVLSIQPQNRKPVSGADFANGARIQADEKFESLMDN
jgi:methionyl-tRNA formyltransferase